MKKKLVSYFVTNLTVASAGLLITMLFLDWVNYHVEGLGSFILDAYEISYFWPSGQAIDSQDLVWVAPGLVVAAISMMLPVLLMIMKKKATLFFWANVAIIGIVIIVQNWGLGHATDQIYSQVHELPDEEYLYALNFPFYSLGFSVLAAVIYTFYGRKLD